MQGDRYTRLISWLKVLFPLAALGLLSTLFLLSRAIDPGQAIPFAEKEVQDRLRDQQITGPFFTGATSEGTSCRSMPMCSPAPTGRPA